MKYINIKVCTLILGLALLMPVQLFSANRLQLAGTGSQNNSQENTVQQQPEQSGQGELLSLSEVGNLLDDVKGEPLVLPDDPDKLDFIKGAWSFDKAIKGQDGQDMRMDFAFNADGQGAATLSGAKEGVYTAKAKASVDGDLVKIVTGMFVNPATGRAYAPEFIECKKGPNGVECSGTDGFSRWSGERILRQTEGQNTVLAEKARDTGMAQSENTQSAQTTGQTAGKKRDISQQLPPPGGNEGQKLAELSSGGAEVAPYIMENTKKAQTVNGKARVSGLQGDWIYSQELARQEDGRSITLGFSFDGNGKGQSFITDNSGQAFKAAAEAMEMPNGIIRVKTDAYSNGKGQGYYPTFMECKKGTSQDLNCDVSNGWMRVNNGKLLSKNSYEEQNRKNNIEEVLNLTPVSKEEQQSQNRKTIEDVMSDLPQHADDVQQNQTALQLPESKNDTNMSFLQGKWRCNTGLARVADNQPIVLEFNFNKNGQGQASVQEKSGQVYTASANATYRNGVLRINTSDYRSKNARGGYYKSFIQCRNEGSVAICSGENGGIHWSNATFLRQ